jgi:uncharacterized protein (DUF885 family)
MRAWLSAIAAILLAGAAIAAPAPPPPQAATEALHALFDRHWDRTMAENPTWASTLGDRRYDDRWPDLSPGAIDASHAADRAALEELGRLDRASLPAAERLDYDLFARMLRDRIDAHRFKPWVYALNMRSGIQNEHELLEALAFRAPADWENWLARLRSFGTYMDQTIALLEQGAREGRTQPRVIMERIPAQLRRQQVADPAASPFYAPFSRLPESMPAADRDRLQAAARAAIAEVVIPAYARLEKFLAERYLPASRDSAGIWDTPDGRDWYANRIAHFTTTSLTAEEIHEIGLAEVRRIRGEMERIIREVGFEGSFHEFLADLRTNTRFYYPTSDELFRAYLAASKRIDPLLSPLFRTLPRTPYGVRPIPMSSAPDTTTAYYMPPSRDGLRPGYYYVNLYRPDQRPKYEIPVLSVHEAVPGHHLQIALAQELPEAPMFRRFGGFTAFVEGWALYSESLGEEMGLYEDPYDRFGYLTYEMWRAVRLVVDTGLHHEGWTRAQAIEFFRDNAAKSELDIANEIDRYIGWPGQALAYKIGQLRLRALRAEAERALGDRYDIRDFHDVVLGAGALPLDLLEARVRAWVAAGGAAARP